MRFVVARSSLRRLLASKLGVETQQLEFCENAFGKPFLLRPSALMHFNTSHSGEWILHALDTVAPVGVDVEFVRPDLARTEDFALVLSPEEFLQIADRNPAHSPLRWQFEEIEIDTKHVACVVCSGADTHGAAVRAAVVRDLRPSEAERS